MEFPIVAGIMIFFGGFIFGKFVFSPRRNNSVDDLRDQREERENSSIVHALAGQEALDVELAKPEIYLSLSYLNEDGKVAHVHTDVILPTMQFNPGGFHVTKAEEHANEMLADMARRGTYKGENDNGELMYIPAARFLNAKVISCE